jgi:hypothetical protein
MTPAPLFPNEDCQRMALRHAFAVLLCGVGVVVMHKSYPAEFDGVGAVSLFTTVIAVAQEDVSLGPIIHKSVLRVIGVCMGGLLGFLLLYFPVVFLKDGREVCLVLLLTVYVFMAQYSTRGGWPKVAAYLKERKAAHMTLQFQLAFGTVFIGGWTADKNSVATCLIRTMAIVYGCFCVLLASLVTMPQTSLFASCTELAQSLRAGGKLAVMVCNDRTKGVLLEPYDHLARGFAALKPDDHIALMDILDTKLTRVQTLQPFLHFEPAWVPGLSIQLIGKETLFAPNWCSFVATVASRLMRLRCTLTVMDSMSRIDSDGIAKTFHPDVANKLESLSVLVKESLDVIAVYIESPFTQNGGYQGDTSLRVEMAECLSKTKDAIQQLVNCIIRQVQSSNTIQANKRSLDTAEDITHPVPTMMPDTGVNQFRERHRGLDVKTKLVRDRLGAATIECWHRIFPMRTFCTIAVQCALQAATLLVDVVAFIDFISNTIAAAAITSTSDAKGAYQQLDEFGGLYVEMPLSRTYEGLIENSSGQEKYEIEIASADGDLQPTIHDDDETIAAIRTSRAWSHYSEENELVDSAQI